MNKKEENYIHGRDMVEDFGLSHEAIKIAKRTAFGSSTEMQVFAIGVQRGFEERDAEVESLKKQVAMLEDALIQLDDLPFACQKLEELEEIS